MCEITKILLHCLFGLLLARLALRDQKEKSVSLSSLIVTLLLSILMTMIRVLSAQEDLFWILGDTGCGLCIGILSLMISMMSGERIGYGDSLMLLILGIGIGGWNLVCLLQVVSFLMLLYVLWMWRKRKMNKDTRIAFYPFLFLGYVSYLFDAVFIRNNIY